MNEEKPELPKGPIIETPPPPEDKPLLPVRFGARDLGIFAIGLAGLLTSGYIGGSLRPHGHASPTDGGSALTPATVTGTSNMLTTGGYLAAGGTPSGSPGTTQGTVVSAYQGSANSGVFCYGYNCNNYDYFDGTRKQHIIAGTLLGATGPNGWELFDSTGTRLNQYESIYATSIDGAVSMSTGCVVVINTGNGNRSNANWLTITSTTTASAQPWLGVNMTAGCAPGTLCKIAVRGLVRAQIPAGQTVGNKLSTTGTRCQLQTQAAYSGQYSGILMATDGNGWGTVYLSGP